MLDTFGAVPLHDLKANNNIHFCFFLGVPLLIQAALEPVRVDEPIYRSSQTAEMFGGRCGLLL